MCENLSEVCWERLGEGKGTLLSFEELSYKGEYKKARGRSCRMGEHRVEREFVFCCSFRLEGLTAYLYVDEKNPIERSKGGLVGKRKKKCWCSYL